MFQLVGIQYFRPSGPLCGDRSTSVAPDTESMRLSCINSCFHTHKTRGALDSDVTEAFSLANRVAPRILYQWCGMDTVWVREQGVTCPTYEERPTDPNMDLADSQTCRVLDLEEAVAACTISTLRGRGFSCAAQLCAPRRKPLLSVLERWQ